METLEGKSLVYRIVKERYLWEHERKNELNNIISIPLGLMSIIIGCLAYFFNNLPINSNSVLFFLYYFFIVISILCLFFCLFCFYRHQTGYTYCYISSPDKLYEYEQNYIKSFNDNNVEVDYNIINDKVCLILYEQYSNAATQNKTNNERKIKFYRYLIISITICIIFLSATFYCRINLENQEVSPTKIETISPIELEINKDIPINNIDIKIKDSIPLKIEKDLNEMPKEEKMANENEKKVEQPKMTASQVPAPEPPKMEMLTESYNPLNFTKEEIINFSKNKKEQ